MLTFIIWKLRRCRNGDWCKPQIISKISNDSSRLIILQVFCLNEELRLKWLRNVSRNIKDASSKNWYVKKDCSNLKGFGWKIY